MHTGIFNCKMILLYYHYPTFNQSSLKNFGMDIMIYFAIKVLGEELLQR